MTPPGYLLHLLWQATVGEVVGTWARWRRRWATLRALDLPARGDLWQQPGTLVLVEVVRVVPSRGDGVRYVVAVDGALRRLRYDDLREMVTGWTLLERAGRQL